MSFKFIEGLSLLYRLLTIKFDITKVEDNLYRFSSKDGNGAPFYIRTYSNLFGCCCTDGLDKAVELLDEHSNIQVREEWFENFSSYAKPVNHPMEGLANFLENLTKAAPKTASPS